MPGTWARCRRIAFAVICLFVSNAIAGAAFAAKLVDVRVGVHPGYTRVVLETDQKAAYALTPKDDELLVQVDASGAAEAITTRSNQLLWVRVQPSGADTDVRIQVKGTVEVRQMVLGGPHRIVLDLYPATAASKAAATVPAPKAEPAPEPAPVAETAPAPTPAPSPTAASEAAEVADAAPAGDSEASDAPTAPAAPTDTASAAPTAGDDAAYPEEPAGGAAGAEGAEPAALDEMAGGAPSEGPGAAGAEPTGDQLADAAPVAPAEPVAPEPAPAERPRVEPPEPEPASEGGLIGLLLSPPGLGGLALLFLVVFLLLRRRGGGENAEDVDAVDAFASEEPGEAGEAVAFAERPSDETDEVDEAADDAVVVPEPGVDDAADDDLSEGEEPALGSEDSLFDVAEDEITPAAEPETVPSEPTVAAVGAAASIPSEGPPKEWVEEYGEEMAQIIQELESRVSHLETRLEEVLDSKERLERQVSAQTEELRVQRAAIARTQRVLRTVSRPEDEASEPVPKV